LLLSVKPVCPHPTRRSIIAAAAGLAAAGLWSNSSSAQTEVAGLPDAAEALTKVMPTVAPRLVFANPQGQQLSLAHYAGHALVVNLWATWCGPCVAELPTLAALAATVRPYGILVLPISIDLTGAAAVQPYYAKHGIRDLPVLLDPNGDNMQVLDTNAIPLTIIINASGQLVARVDGAADWDTPDVVAFLRSLGGAGTAHKAGGVMAI
jgi:thiol-disulfide isomerase/thioredoxin